MIIPSMTFFSDNKNLLLNQAFDANEFIIIDFENDTQSIFKSNKFMYYGITKIDRYNMKIPIRYNNTINIIDIKNKSNIETNINIENILAVSEWNELGNKIIVLDSNRKNEFYIVDIK